MTNNTLATQQERSGINIVVCRACERGLSALVASLTLKARAVHILEEPPELKLAIATMSIDDRRQKSQGKFDDPIHGRPHLARCVNR